MEQWAYFHHKTSNDIDIIYEMHSFFLISASLMFISTTGYLLLETATFLERAESFYAAITVANCIVYFIVQFTKREEMFALIGLFEEFINKRMYE